VGQPLPPSPLALTGPVAGSVIPVQPQTPDGPGTAPFWPRRSPVRAQPGPVRGGRITHRAGAPQGLWSVLQSAGNNSFATSVAATFSTSNIASTSSKIFAFVGSSWSDAPTSVKDGSNNALTLLPGCSKTSGTGSVWVYAMDAPAGDVGTKPTITVIFPSSNGQSILIQEVSGLASGVTSSFVDGTPVGLLGTTASTGSPSYSSSASGEYLTCFYADNDGSSTVTKTDATWTLDANNQHVFSSAQLEYKNSTGGSETSGFGSANSGGWAVLTVAFKLATPAVAGPPVRPPGGPVLARIPQPPRGGRITRQSGVYAGTGPAVRSAKEPVRAQLAGPWLTGRSDSRAGVFAGLGPAVKALTSTVAAKLRVLPVRGRTAGRSGTFTAAAPQQGPPVYPLGHPVQAKKQPARGGTVASRDGTFAQAGPAIKPTGGPVRVRIPQPVRGGQADGRSGIFAGAGPPVRAPSCPVAAKQRFLPPRGRTASLEGVFGGTGPSVRPLGGPVQARRLAVRGGNSDGRSGTFTAPTPQSGPPIYPLGHPVQARRLPIRGGNADGRAGTYATQGPPVRSLDGPVRAQPGQRRGGQAEWRAGTYSVAGPVTSGALEAFGFGGFPRASGSITTVSASAGAFGSDAQMNAPSYQLWDGTAAQLGVQAGSASTSSAHVDTVTFTGVTVTQLGTLRLRLYAQSQPGNSGAAESADWMSLTAVFVAEVDANITPALVAAIAGFGSATVTAITNASITASTLVATAGFPQCTVGVLNATATPALVAATAGFGQCTVSAVSNATITASALVATAGFPQCTTGLYTATVTAAQLSAFASFAAATVTAITNTSATASILNATAGFPQCTSGLYAASAANASLSAVAAFAQCTVSVVINATMTPAVLTVTAGFSAATITVNVDGPYYATTQRVIADGSGTWVNPQNITGPPDAAVAVWTVP